MSPLTELCCKRTVEIIQTHLVYALNGRMHNGELSSSFSLLLFVALLQSKLLYIFPCVTLGWSRFLLCDSSFRVPFYLSFQRSKAMSAPSLRWFVCSFIFFSTWCFCPFYSKRQSIKRSFWQCIAIVQCTHVRCSDGEPHLFINITQSNRFISHCQQL